MQDEDGVTTSAFAYDSDGRATYAGQLNGIRSVTLSYSGSSTTVTNSKGYAETHDLGTAGSRKRALSRTSTCADGCAQNGQLITGSYDQNGNRTSLRGKDDVLTCTSYDLARNLPLVRIEGLLGSVNNCTSALSSPPAYGRVTKWQWHATMPVPTAISGPLAITTFHLDAAGRALSTTIRATSDANGAAGFSAQAVGPARTWQTTYDPEGFVTRVKAPRGDVDATTTFAYDGAKNLSTVTDPVGLVTSYGNYDANGRPGLITEPNGLQTSVTYDGRGHVAQMNVGGAVTTYTYSPGGRPVTVALPTGVTLTYGYDSAGRLTSVTDNLGNSTAMTLDSEGNVTSESVTGNGAALAFSRQRAYDSLSRLTSLTKAQ